MEVTEIAVRPAYADNGNIGFKASVMTKGGHAGTALCAPAICRGRYERPMSISKKIDFRELGLQRESERLCRTANRLLSGVKATDLRTYDNIIAEIKEDGIGTIGTCAISEAILQTCACSLHQEPYQLIGRKERFSLPVPTYTAAMGSTRYGDHSKAGGQPSYFFVAYGFDSFSEAVYGLWLTVSVCAGLLTKVLGFKVEIDSENMIPKGSIENDEQLLRIMKQAIENAGQSGCIGIGIDLGADHYYDVQSECYHDILCKGKLTRGDLIKTIVDLCSIYPVVLLQDPLHADDFEGTAEIRRAVSAAVIGGEMVASRRDRIERGIAYGAFDGVYISAAQAGTLTAAAELCAYAEERGLLVCTQERCAEDVHAADYAVGMGCNVLLGCGVSFLCSRLLEIEEKLGEKARFDGRRIFENRGGLK